MEKKLDINELIKVESLPKIFYQLELIGKQIDKALDGVDEMECNEDNNKEVKKRKQEITAFKNMMEDKRKEIKKQVMAKYDEFNEKYTDEVLTKLVKAETTLNEKVTVIENQQKQDKRENIELFANEHFKFNNIEDIVCFDDMNLNITLTASEKSLKEQVLQFCERIVNDLKLIELEEYKDEILVEYKKNLDFTKSKLEVCTRYKMLEEVKQRNEQQVAKKEQEEQVVAVVEEVVAPKVVDDEDVITCSFTVTGTKSQIKQIKNLILELGVEYK